MKRPSREPGPRDGRWSGGRAGGSAPEPGSSAISGTTNADAVIDAMAGRQRGVVTRRQLLGAGVPAHVVEFRLRKGRLRPLYRGVYAVGSLRVRHARETAAVLAAGEGALLSHRSAGVLWKHLARPREEAPVEVSTPGRHPRPGPGVRVHRIGAIRDDEATSLQGLAITTPARTLLDLAAVVTSRELERALARARREGLEDRRLMVLLERYPRRAGTPLLRSLLAKENLIFTRSEAEERFLALVESGGLPGPEVNARVQECEVDFLWRTARLIIEVDGFAFHSSRAAFERDRRRDQLLFGAGYTVLRFTWAQVTKEREHVLAQVAAALVRVEQGRR